MIYKITSLVFLLFVSSCENKSSLNYEKIDLHSDLNELSGLEFFDSKLLTHNDSGFDNILFASNLDSIKFKKIKINHTNNIDWEDICLDNKFIYLADVGNNYAFRKDLKIYKISKKFKLVDSIKISYALQNNFENKPKNKFDAEAIISYKNNLILFSKNRIDNESFIYQIPKDVNNISLSPIDKVTFKGLITGADYSEELGLLVLVGYSNNQAEQYIHFIPKFSLPIEKQSIITIKLPFNQSQIEGVKIISNNLIIISSEDETNSKPFLAKIHIKNGLFNSFGKFKLTN